MKAKAKKKSTNGKTIRTNEIITRGMRVRTEYGIGTVQAITQKPALHGNSNYAPPHDELMGIARVKLDKPARCPDSEVDGYTILHFGIAHPNGHFKSEIQSVKRSR